MIIQIIDELGRETMAHDKALATVLAKGDLGSVESTKVVPLDAAGEDATFNGIVWMSAGADVTEVIMLKRCIALVTVDSATYIEGAGLKYSSGDNGTEYVFNADGNANTICWAAESKASATKLKVLFDVRLLATVGKLYDIASA